MAQLDPDEAPAPVSARQHVAQSTPARPRRPIGESILAWVGLVTFIAVSALIFGGGL